MDGKEINPDMENQAVIGRKVNWIGELQRQRRNLQMWNNIFVISCVFAVSLDPLFFYVVNVEQDEKCLHTDKKLKIVTLVMRTLTDVIFLVHLICEISDSVQKTMDKKSTSTSKMSTPNNEPSEAVKQTSENSGKKREDRKLIQHAKKKAQNMSWLSIIIDVLALLPLPQLIILMLYPTKDSGFLEHKIFVNVFLLGQYVPRIFRIHLSAKEFKKRHGIWANGLFNLFLYILAGHVLGAFWYFSSIQREASCWYKACDKLRDACEDTSCIGCKNTLYCDPESTTAINIIRHLNESCPLDTSNDTLSSFNFGIFLDSLKNENPDQKFGKKFLYSFWWGLRNLSNFGTNLVTSTYVWENLFAILISVIGLLLFIYLIGNVQAFMQMGATKTEYMSGRRKKKKEAKKTLRKIPMLKDMDEKVLKMMCDHYLKPATFIENSFVFRTGDPLDCFLLIIEGTMWTYASSDSHAGQGISSMAIKPLRKGDFYGEELLDWASDFTKVPVSSKHVKSHTKVEAFVLMAEDLVTPLGPHRDLPNCNNPEEVEKMTLSAFLQAQRLPASVPG